MKTLKHIMILLLTLSCRGQALGVEEISTTSDTSEHVTDFFTTGLQSDDDRTTANPADIFSPSLNFTFPPDLYPPGSILTVAGELRVVYISYRCEDCHPRSFLELQPLVTGEDIVRIVDHTWSNISMETGFTGGGNITFLGMFIGKSSLTVHVVDHTGFQESFTQEQVIQVNTRRPERTIDLVFNVLTAVLLSLNTVGHSCSMELKVVRDHIKKPIGVLIGFFCQYLVMPSIAFGMAVGFRLPNSLAFGLLAYGASPGGGTSNIWTILLDGDINLSLTMTLFSTLLSLGMTTLWVSTAGNLFIRPSLIPYQNIVLGLTLFISSCIIGLLLSRFLPKLAKFIVKTLKVFNLVLIAFFVVLGTIANLYIWRLVTYKVFIPAMLISWTGYAVALLGGAILRRPWKEVKTVAIETGCQNGGIAILIVRFSMPPPDGDLATVAPLMAMITSSIPLICVLLLCKLYDRSGPEKPRSDVIVGNARNIEIDNRAFDQIDDESGPGSDLSPPCMSKLTPAVADTQETRTSESRRGAKPVNINMTVTAKYETGECSTPNNRKRKQGSITADDRQRMQCKKRATAEDRETEGIVASEDRETEGTAASEDRETEGTAASEDRETEGTAASEDRDTEGTSSPEDRERIEPAATEDRDCIEPAASEDRATEGIASSEDKATERTAASEDRATEGTYASEDMESERTHASEDMESEGTHASEDMESEGTHASEDMESEGTHASEDRETEWVAVSEDREHLEPAASENISTERNPASEDREFDASCLHIKLEIIGETDVDLID